MLKIRCFLEIKSDQIDLNVTTNAEKTGFFGANVFISCFFMVSAIHSLGLMLMSKY